MDIQDLRKAYESASQQVHVLESYLHELVQRCERSDMNPDTDHNYTTFKLKIMSEVKALYEHYRDMKQEQFQHQCASELTDILNHLPSEHQSTNEDYSLDFDFPRSSTPIIDDLDIHRVPSMLSPIEEPVFDDSDDLLDMPFSDMDFLSDLATDQLRDV